MADNEKMVLTKGSSDQTKAAVAMNNSTMSATKLAAAQANLKRSIESVGAKSTMATKKAAAAQDNSTRQQKRQLRHRLVQPWQQHRQWQGQRCPNKSQMRCMVELSKQLLNKITSN